jgi:heat shock protein HslJ
MKTLTGVAAVVVFAVAVGVVSAPAGAVAAAPPGGSTPDAASADGELWQRTFRSTAVRQHGQPHDLLPGTRIRLALRDGGLEAYAGCGGIVGVAADGADVVGVADGRAGVAAGAGVAADGAGRLVVTDLNVWRNGCADDERFSQDLWLAAFLDGDPVWRLAGDELVLADGDTSISFTDSAEVAADPPLADTYWVIEAIVEGDSVTPVPAFPQPYLLLPAGQRLEAFDGCNWLSGSAEVAGDAITFGGVGTTKRLCPHSNLLVEMKIFAALDDGPVSYRIEAGRLELSRAGGPGLRLRSQS